MKLTNKLNLPQPIVSAVANDSYTRGASDISITGLMKPPRMTVLEDAFYDKLEEDVSDRIWSLTGQVIHGILERANSTGISEQRLFIKVEGWNVSGQIDRFDNGVLQDYKFTSVYKVQDGVPLEYEQQMNAYAHLLRYFGHVVERLELIAILRDWSKMESKRDRNYPTCQVLKLDVPVWKDADAAKFIRDRVILHKQARVSLPECTPTDRWARPDVYAVMKTGKDRAIKLYDNEADAKAHAGDDKTLSVVHRPGVNTRCESYCSVANYCEQFINLKKGKDAK